MPEYRIIFEGVFDGPTRELAIEAARQQIQDTHFEPVMADLEDAEGPYVTDPEEQRSWGPFADEDDANRFIESDKYLESWCAVTNPPPSNWPVYAPSVYHGTWPR